MDWQIFLRFDLERYDWQCEMYVLSSSSQVKLRAEDFLPGMQRARPLLFETATVWDRKDHNLGRGPRRRGRGGARGRGVFEGRVGARGRGGGGAAPRTDPGEDDALEPPAGLDADVAQAVVDEEVCDDDLLDPLLGELEPSELAKLDTEQVIACEFSVHVVISILILK